MQFNPQENIKAKSSIIKDAHVMCYPCNSIDHDEAFPLSKPATLLRMNFPFNETGRLSELD